MTFRFEPLTALAAAIGGCIGAALVVRFVFLPPRNRKAQP